MEADLGIPAVKEAIGQFGVPEIVNSPSRVCRDTGNADREW
jgi:hypothetical protein